MVKGALPPPGRGSPPPLQAADGGRAHAAPSGCVRRRHGPDQNGAAGRGDSAIGLGAFWGCSTACRRVHCLPR
jgi:hypothetical protein